MKINNILLMIMVLSSICIPQNLFAVSWGSPVKISDNENPPYSPLVAVDKEGNIYAIWESCSEYGYISCLEDNIYFSKRDSSNLIWSPSKSLIQEKYPVIADVNMIIDSSVIYIFFSASKEDSFLPNNYDIYFIKSNDQGNTWSNINKINDDTIQKRRRILKIVINKNIYILWIDSSDSDIYFAKSIDEGDTWSPSVKITNGSNAKIAISEKGNIYVIWQIYSSIYFMKSLDEGRSWSRSIKIIDSGSYPDILVKNNIIYITWNYSAYSDRVCDSRIDNYIYLTRSFDEGESWSEKIVALSVEYEIGSSADLKPKIIFNDDILDVVAEYYEGRYRYPCIKEDYYYNKSVYFAEGLNNGLTWSSKNEIKNGFGDASDPDIATNNSGNVYIVWVAESSSSYPFKSAIYFIEGTQDAIPPLSLAS